jgi:hypothetical protein
MPYLRVTEITFDPASADESVRQARAVIQVMRGQPGFQDIRAGIDREGGRGFAITTFDTREHASLDRQRLGDAFRESMAVLRYAPPIILEVLD